MYFYFNKCRLLRLVVLRDFYSSNSLNIKQISTYPNSQTLYMTPASTLKINKNLFSMSLLLLDNETNSANDVRVNGEKKTNFYREIVIVLVSFRRGDISKPSTNSYSEHTLVVYVCF